MTRRSESHERLREEAEKLGLELVSMPTTYELPDGARIVVTGPKRVPMGEFFAYEQLTYSRGADGERPAREIVFEVRNREPVCASIKLGGHDETCVQAGDLESIRLDDLRDNIYACVGVFVPNPDGGDLIHRIGPAAFLQDRKRVQSVTRRRRLKRAFLMEVAKVHQAAPEGTRIKAVKAAFHVEDSQANRYIKAARKEGLIS